MLDHHRFAETCEILLTSRAHGLLARWPFVHYDEEVVLVACPAEHLLAQLVQRDLRDVLLLKDCSSWQAENAPLGNAGVHIVDLQADCQILRRALPSWCCCRHGKLQLFAPSSQSLTSRAVHPREHNLAGKLDLLQSRRLAWDQLADGFVLAKAFVENAERRTLQAIRKGKVLVHPQAGSYVRDL